MSKEEKEIMTNIDIAFYIFMILIPTFGISIGIIVFLFPNESYPLSFMYILGSLSIGVSLFNYFLLYINYKRRFGKSK